MTCIQWKIEPVFFAYEYRKDSMTSYDLLVNFERGSCCLENVSFVLLPGIS